MALLSVEHKKRRVKIGVALVGGQGSARRAVPGSTTCASSEQIRLQIANGGSEPLALFSTRYASSLVPATSLLTVLGCTPNSRATSAAVFRPDGLLLMSALSEGQGELMEAAGYLHEHHELSTDLAELAHRFAELEVGAATLLDQAELAEAGGPVSFTREALTERVAAEGG